eukprot:3712169-Amphidinium_carterae.2
MVAPLLLQLFRLKSQAVPARWVGTRWVACGTGAPLAPSFHCLSGPKKTHAERTSPRSGKKFAEIRSPVTLLTFWSERRTGHLVISVMRRYHALLLHAFRHLQRVGLEDVDREGKQPWPKTEAFSKRELCKACAARRRWLHTSAFRSHRCRTSKDVPVVSCVQTTQPLGLQRAEDLLGIEAAEAWIAYFRALAERPAILPALARSAGWTDAERLGERERVSQACEVGVFCAEAMVLYRA